ncbi:hypothetical protein EHQ12_13655 [Leptospira gomenensis]|uniref:TonB C-terminal domain-containing protein n=1 Tax=Leptospira gomenensis TaxID=2484974 RepID=A0A5F1YQ19_9LEPT|nr:energy transducer TonB [Leptospira gomenensis]TGK28041.1 hypothetical protein EHQ17_18310 [Leptospira gomenensis]TGK37228.1 hypothetical protein EHQ12_13655 [Leptospira gomenensis]TGK45740.1 hypothetical protein EHQ07_08665 [Leptospira gomenensis]TGK59679.1 hypothetical protein EHQ13_12875 [Leptospira gomenensis]
MDLRFCFLISGLFHVLILIGYGFFFRKAESTTDIRIFLKKGADLNFVLDFNRDGSGKNAESERKSPSDPRGTLEKEIRRFQNEIHFPERALEQRLESDCSWEVRIKSGGKGEILRTIQPCAYSIFENEFRRALKTWKFELEEDTNIIIPVSFKIDEREL